MATKRALIEPLKCDDRYIRRATVGEFTEKQLDVGNSLAADHRSHSKIVAPQGPGRLGRPKEGWRLGDDSWFCVSRQGCTSRAAPQG
jgi:hypothetical protein